MSEPVSAPPVPVTSGTDARPAPPALSRPRPRGGGRSPSAPYAFLAPFVVLFVVFLVLPIVVAVYTSFFAVQRSGLGFGGGSEPVFVGFANYLDALRNAEFLESFGRVLLFGVVQVPLMIAFAAALALILDSAVLRFKRFFQLSIFLPFAVPSVVAALLWGFLYQPRVSPIVEFLHGIGFQVDLLAPGTVLWSIANVSIWSVTGVNMIILFASLQTVPREMYEAARIDGAGEIRTALRIKLPMIFPAIVLTTLFSIIGTLQLFNEPMTMRSITSNVTGAYTPNMAIYRTTTLGGDAHAGSAMAVVLGLVAFALSVIVSVASRRRNEAVR